MKYFEWNAEKNEELGKERGITFEEVVFCLMHGGLLDTIEHPNQEKYQNQRIFIINIEDYVYLVPFVEKEENIFLCWVMSKIKFSRQIIKYIGFPPEVGPSIFMAETG